MRKARLAVFVAATLSIVASTVPTAQQSDNRRKPKQTHDKGIDDVDVTPAAQQRVGERDAAGARVFRRADGVLVAQLDESFHDALVATKNTDGTISYTCLHGLPAADGYAKAHARTAAKAKPVQSRLEEK